MEGFWISTGRAERRAVAEIRELVAREDGILWIDIPECDADALAVMRDVLHFHPLANLGGLRDLVTVHGPINPDVPLDHALRETRAVAKRSTGASCRRPRRNSGTQSSR